MTKRSTENNRTVEKNQFSFYEFLDKPDKLCGMVEKLKLWANQGSKSFLDKVMLTVPDLLQIRDQVKNKEVKIAVLLAKTIEFASKTVVDKVVHVLPYSRAASTSIRMTPNPDAVMIAIATGVSKVLAIKAKQGELKIQFTSTEATVIDFMSCFLGRVLPLVSYEVGIRLMNLFHLLLTSQDMGEFFEELAELSTGYSLQVIELLPVTKIYFPQQIAQIGLVKLLLKHVLESDFKASDFNSTLVSLCISLGWKVVQTFSDEQKMTIANAIVRETDENSAKYFTGILNSITLEKDIAANQNAHTVLKKKEAFKIEVCQHPQSRYLGKFLKSESRHWNLLSSANLITKSTLLDRQPKEKLIKYSIHDLNEESQRKTCHFEYIRTMLNRAVDSSRESNVETYYCISKLTIWKLKKIQERIQLRADIYTLHTKKRLASIVKEFEQPIRKMFIKKTLLLQFPSCWILWLLMTRQTLTFDDSEIISVCVGDTLVISIYKTELKIHYLKRKSKNCGLLKISETKQHKLPLIPKSSQTFENHFVLNDRVFGLSYEILPTDSGDFGSSKKKGLLLILLKSNTPSSQCKFISLDFEAANYLYVPSLDLLLFDLNRTNITVLSFVIPQLFF